MALVVYLKHAPIRECVLADLEKLAFLPGAQVVVMFLENKPSVVALM